jgi:hypothetical protein
VASGARGVSHPFRYPSPWKPRARPAQAIQAGGSRPHSRLHRLPLLHLRRRSLRAFPRSRLACGAQWDDCGGMQPAHTRLRLAESILARTRSQPCRSRETDDRRGCGRTAAAVLRWSRAAAADAQLRKAASTPHLPHGAEPPLTLASEPRSVPPIRSLADHAPARPRPPASMHATVSTT